MTIIKSSFPAQNYFGGAPARRHVLVEKLNGQGWLGLTQSVGHSQIKFSEVG